jgi:hypothetical protein
MNVHIGGMYMYIVSVYVHRVHVSFRRVLTEVGPFRIFLSMYEMNPFAAEQSLEYGIVITLLSKIYCQVKSNQSSQCSAVGEYK